MFPDLAAVFLRLKAMCPLVKIALLRAREGLCFKSVESALWAFAARTVRNSARGGAAS